MLSRVNILQTSRIAIRNLGQSSRLSQLPSSNDMKSEDQWISTPSEQADIHTESSNSAIFKVVQSARNLRDTTAKDPPLNINSKFTRRFETYDIYDPFDFSMNKKAMEEKKPSSRKNTRDPFEATGIDPLDCYTMPEVLSKFVSSTGQILPRDVTGCSSRNQKKLGIAIKRARSCGILSTVHKHSRYCPPRNL